jgi:hypothetical protein
LWFVKVVFHCVSKVQIPSAVVSMSLEYPLPAHLAYQLQAARVDERMFNHYQVVGASRQPLQSCDTGNGVVDRRAAVSLERAGMQAREHSLFSMTSA